MQINPYLSFKGECEAAFKSRARLTLNGSFTTWRRTGEW